MNTREKLIALVRDAKFDVDRICVERDWCEGCPAAYGEGDCKEAYIADHLISHGVTVQEWISVKDRLPEVGDSYLVVVKCKYDWEKEYEIGTDVATFYPYDNPDAYIDNRWDTYNDWDEGQQYIHITHWMPLPQPPMGNKPDHQLDECSPQTE